MQFEGGKKFRFPQNFKIRNYFDTVHVIGLDTGAGLLLNYFGLGGSAAVYIEQTLFRGFITALWSRELSCSLPVHLSVEVCVRGTR